MFLGFGGGVHPGRRVSPDQPPASAALLALNPDALFSQAPYMGVACGVASSIACDRVGLTVWLRRPALAVTAVLGGRAFRLDSPDWSGPVRDGQRRSSPDSSNRPESPLASA